MLLVDDFKLTFCLTTQNPFEALCTSIIYKQIVAITNHINCIYLQ